MQLRVKGMTLAKNDRRWTEFLIERDTAANGASWRASNRPKKSAPFSMSGLTKTACS